MSLFISLKEYLIKKEADRHEELKDKIRALQELRGVHNIFVDKDKRVIEKCDRKIAKLQKKLSGERGIYCL